MFGGRGRPPRHLTTRWTRKMWQCRFLTGRRSLRGCPLLLLLLARGAPQGQRLGFLPQSGSLVWASGWGSGSGPGRGGARSSQVRPQERAWAGRSQMRPWWEAPTGSELPQPPGCRSGVTSSPLPRGRNLFGGAG